MAAERNDQLKQMDEEAVLARRELAQNVDSWNARAMAEWWNRWYLQAGHKRLGRILVDIAKRQQ